MVSMAHNLGTITGKSAELGVFKALIVTWNRAIVREISAALSNDLHAEH